MSRCKPEIEFLSTEKKISTMTSPDVYAVFDGNETDVFDALSTGNAKFADGFLEEELKVLVSERKDYDELVKRFVVNESQIHNKKDSGYFKLYASLEEQHHTKASTFKHFLGHDPELSEILSGLKRPRVCAYVYGEDTKLVHSRDGRTEETPVSPADVGDLTSDFGVDVSDVVRILESSTFRDNKYDDPVVNVCPKPVTKVKYIPLEYFNVTVNGDPIDLVDYVDAGIVVHNIRNQFMAPEISFAIRRSDKYFETYDETYFVLSELLGEPIEKRENPDLGVLLDSVDSRSSSDIMVNFDRGILMTLTEKDGVYYTM